MFQLFKNLLIHGEGGDGASAAPAAAPGAEESGVKAPDAGEKKGRPSKAERRAALEEKLRAEQQQQTAQPEAEPKQEEKTPWEEIKKQYKDEYGKDVQTAIQGRFKNQADNSEELNSAKAELAKRDKLLAQLAATQYGIKPGADGALDFAAIEEAAKKSRAEEYAAEHGISEEYAEQRIQMEDELADKDRRLREFEAAEKARQEDQERYQQFQKHRQQAEAFRQTMPGFDLVREMEQSPLFAKLLSFGCNVEDAYYAAHHKELMAAGQQAAAMQAQRALSANIQAGQSMPTEGGLGRSPAANPQRVIDFKHRTKAERAELHKRVQRGEKIYL